MRKGCIPATALLLAGWMLAAPVQAQVSQSAPRQSQKVYAVADLVTSSLQTCGEDTSCGMLPCCDPVGLWTAQLACSGNGEEQKLIKLITSAVRPKCWAGAGGNCTIEYYPIGMGLVVNAPEDVQKEVGCLLESLRQKRDTSVAVTLRFITVSDGFFERFGLDFDFKCGSAVQCQRLLEADGPACKGGGCNNKSDCCEKGCFDSDCSEKGCCEKGCCDKGCSERGCCDQSCTQPKAIGLNEKQAHLLLEAIQGDRRACVTAAPRVVTHDGQTATVTVQDYHLYATGMTINCCNDGQVLATPQMTKLWTGLQTAVTPKVSADRKFISLHLQADHTYLEDQAVRLVPVTFTVVPKLPCGSEGKPEPVTQYIQQPKFKSLKVDAHLTVPCGGSMLVYGGLVEKIVRPEGTPPVLSKIPYLHRLFRATRARTREHLLVLVTPTVVPEPTSAVVAGQACPGCSTTTAKAATKTTTTRTIVVAAPAANCTPSKPVPTVSKFTQATPQQCTAASSVSTSDDRIAKATARLVQMYRAACAEGRTEHARELAQTALELDPMCFAKPSDSVVPARATMSVPVVPTPPMPIMPPQSMLTPSMPATPQAVMPHSFVPAKPTSMELMTFDLPVGMSTKPCPMPGLLKRVMEGISNRSNGICLELQQQGTPGSLTEQAKLPMPEPGKPGAVQNGQVWRVQLKVQTNPTAPMAEPQK